MAKKLSIEVENRNALGTSASRRLRRQGKVAGVIYGYGKDALPVSLSAQVVEQLKHHPGLVTISVAGDDVGKTYTAIVKDEQIDPITGVMLHMDLQEVRADEVIEALVEIVAHGDPVGVHRGGELLQALRELEVKCLPDDMIETLMVEVSQLELDQGIHVRDLTLPNGVTAISDPDQVVFQVRLPRRVEEETPAEEAIVEEGAAEPELVGRKKKEGEEEEQEGAPAKKEAKREPKKEGKKE